MSVMIDGLKLKIPFSLPKPGKDITRRVYHPELDLFFHLPVITASMDIERNGYSLNLHHLDVMYWQQMKGQTEVFECVHKFESLESNYSGLALKVVQNKDEPCVWLFGSPAKLMQGHNVFGTDSLKDCYLTFINILHQNYPVLFSFLDLEKSELLFLDVTASTRVGSESELKQVLDFLRNIQSGHTHQNRKNYQYTVYWGSNNSDRKQLKVYAKFQEIEHSLRHYKKTLNPSRYKRIAQAHTEAVKKFAKNLLRFEARLKKKLLKDMGLSLKIIDLCNNQKRNPELMLQLWHRGFDDIMQACKGMTMKIHNDEQVLKNLKVAYRTITKSGKESYSKALKLYSFYQSIKSFGYEAVKCQYPPSSSTFHRLKNDLLTGAGISLAFLQNLHVQQNAKVVPLIKYLDIDFNNQVPEGYMLPTYDNIVPFQKIA